MNIYENHRIFTSTLAGRPFIVEVNKFAQLANGSCLVRYGETSIMATATASEKPRAGIDFFPLSVDYEEKLYSVGKIPGSFMKREGRPPEKAILAGRQIDRPIRPLFPKDMRNDVNVSITPMSVDNDCSPEIAGMIAASIAISISDIPWAGPIGGMLLGYVDGQYVFNPTEEQRKVSQMAVTLAASAEKVVMIEAVASEINEEIMFEGIKQAHEEIKKTVAFINEIKAAVGKPKFEYEAHTVDQDKYNDIKSNFTDKIRFALDTDDKDVRDARMLVVKNEIQEMFGEKYPESEAEFTEIIEKINKALVRAMIIDEHKRVDGRGLLDIRPLYAEVGILPRVHGTGLFSRGQTQVLTIATLGTIGESQLLDGVDNEETKRYMHHYNMPGYSTGEAKSSRSPGRREIGHGALAEKALEAVLPDVEAFPYSIRLVSEVLSSNGSTSQGAVCGSTLALMDAGVPIKAPVAGISCGLITKDDGTWTTMVDIQGLEDFYGDMDFKVAGTKKGITAIQMDIKVDGLSYEVIQRAFTETRDARYYILDEIMLKAIAEPRAEVSKYAPKIITMKIDPDKIREVIGSGGKVIQKIVAQTGAKIDIEDDGTIFISFIDPKAGKDAQGIIKAIVEEPVIGAMYKGKVTKLMAFGAFVEYAPGKEGLVHISQLDEKRVNKVEDVVAIGDEIWVKITELDAQGRINLSRKAAIFDLMKQNEKPVE